MRPTEVSSNSQLYSDHWTIYSHRFQRSHMMKVFNHEGKLQVMGISLVVRACFSIKARKQITIVACNE